MRPIWLGIVVSTVIVGGCGTPTPDQSRGSEPSGSKKSALEWNATLIAPDEGKLSRACAGEAGEPRQNYTRYRVASDSATQEVRYVTSRGAKGKETLHPGEKLRAKPVGESGSVDWFVRKAHKPETAKLHFEVDFHVPGGTGGYCYVVPFARLVRRSQMND